MHISNIHGVAEAEGILEYCQCREADTLDVHFDEDRFADAKNRLAMFRKDMPVEGGQFTVYEATEACEVRCVPLFGMWHI
jgi:hypothetical protein